MHNVIIIGDKCTDKYIFGECSRLSPEQPVPVLDKTRVEERPGMAGNTEMNLKAFGLNTVLLSQREPITKTRFIDTNSGYQLMRLDETPKVSRIANAELKMAMMHMNPDAIVISDYDKGFLTEDDIEQICENHHRVFLDTKKVLGPWARAAKFIKINNHEYERSHEFIDKYLKDKVIRTMGDEGCTYKDKVYSTKRIETIDLSGAGDTFLAALAVHYTHKEDISKAIKFANKCASQVCRKKGTSIVVKD